MLELIEVATRYPYGATSNLSAFTKLISDSLVQSKE